MKVVFALYLLIIFMIFYLERKQIKTNIDWFYSCTSKRSPIFMIESLLTLVFVLILSNRFSKIMPPIYYEIFTSIIRNGLLVLYLYLAIGKRSKLLLNKIKLWKGIVIFSICFASSLSIANLLPIKDPQHLAHLRIGWANAISSIIGISFVGVGEESLKLSCIVGFLSIGLLILKKRSIIWGIVSCLITSLIFGLMHTFGWGTVAGYDIALSSVIAVCIIAFFRNIWIPMLAHFAMDTTQTLNQLTGAPIQTISVLVCIVLTLSYFVNWISKLRIRKDSVVGQSI